MEQVSNPPPLDDETSRLIYGLNVQYGKFSLLVSLVGTLGQLALSTRMNVEGLNVVEYSWAQ